MIQSKRLVFTNPDVTFGVSYCFVLCDYMFFLLLYVVSYYTCNLHLYDSKEPFMILYLICALRNIYIIKDVPIGIEHYRIDHDLILDNVFQINTMGLYSCAN